MTSNDSRTTPETPSNSSAWSILGITIEASEEEIRSAYLEKIRGISQETEPERFEALRTAFRLLKDPVQRTIVTVGIPPTGDSVHRFLEIATGERRYTGPDAWLAAFDEAKR